MGQGLTYVRRYLYVNMLGISWENDELDAKDYTKKAETSTGRPVENVQQKSKTKDKRM